MESVIGNVLSVDAGQSGVRCELRQGDVWLTSVELAPVDTSCPIVPQLAALLTAAMPSFPDTVTVTIGSTGDGGESPDALLEALRTFGVRRVLLAHDSITSYLGALGNARGVVVASGTGAVTLAVGVSESARVDGWGYLVGDAGSGYSIGRAGLDAVLRSYDGRGPATELSSLVTQDFPSPETMYLELQADPWKVSRIASYAKTILELASRDAVCASILARAAEELALSAIRGLRRVGEHKADEPLIGCLGNLFRSALLFESFSAAVRVELPTARVIRVDGNGLDGARLMATLPGDHPLYKEIRTAHE